MENVAVTVQTKLELQDFINRKLLEWKYNDQELRLNKRRDKELRGNRKQIITDLADRLHNECLIPEQMVAAELFKRIGNKPISRRLQLMYLPAKYKDPNKMPSEETLMKRSVKRVGAALREDEMQILKNTNVVIIPKQKIQGLVEASFHCKNNVVIIVSKDTRRPIAVYPDIRAGDYPIRVEELFNI